MPTSMTEEELEQKVHKMRASNQTLVDAYRPSNWLTHVSNFWIGISLWKRLLFGVVILGGVIGSAVFFQIPLMLMVGLAVGGLSVGLNVIFSAHYNEIKFSRTFIETNLENRMSYLEISLAHLQSKKALLIEQELRLSQLEQELTAKVNELADVKQQLKETEASFGLLEQSFEVKIQTLEANCLELQSQNATLRASIGFLSQTVEKLNQITSKNADLTQVVSQLGNHVEQSQKDHDARIQHLKEITEVLERQTTGYGRNNQQLERIINRIDPYLNRGAGTLFESRNETSRNTTPPPTTPPTPLLEVRA